MKKSVIVFLLAAVTLSACSTYTCATYAKEPSKKTVKETRI
jgi:hypothetical protein